MWFQISNAQQVNTPSLAIYPTRILQNIHAMKSRVQSTQHLCPHIKTHKSSEILSCFIESGISQFKCANLAELALVAESQSTFALHAMQCVGPQVAAFARLAASHPHCTFATLVDNSQSLHELAECVAQHGIHVDVLVDVNNGMNRTGIRPHSQEAFELYQEIARCDSVNAGGLHVYDGHIHDSDINVRTARVNEAMDDVLALRERILADGLAVPRLITGGTPTFPIHAQYEDRICSPGTPALWDAGYSESFPDLEFLPSAVLLTRVTSSLGEGLYCLDLGYKSIAAEMRPPRAKFLNIPVVEEVSHSEEHLVVRVDGTTSLNVGDLVYALPWHICPTVARHHELLVVEDQKVVNRWSVGARDRVLGV